MSEIETNLIYCGDNLEILAKFPENSVDLIYADPPFFSNKNYEIIWGNGAELRAFGDRWKGGINVYIEWMKERIWQCWRVLKKTGSMYLHCDWHASHRLRVAMDEIFGEKNFQNEVVWWYHTGGASKKRFARSHGSLLFYTKGEKWTFNWKELKYRRTKKALERAKNPKGARISINDIYKVPEDVLEIQQMNPMAKERLGYPTQKPEALLRPIILVSSNPGEIVLDPFCGCGTTLVVAQRFNRKWVGIDVSPIACGFIKNRLEKAGATDVRIIGAPKTIQELKNLKPHEFQCWVIDKINGTHSTKKGPDMGVDGYTYLNCRPVQVKQQERVGRIVVDKFETAVRRKGQIIGYIVAFSFIKSAYEEAARAKKEGLEIILVQVDEIDKYF